MAKNESEAKPAEKPAATPKRSKKARKMVSEGVAHIHSTFNNTIITITDPIGQRGGVVERRLGRLQRIAQGDAVRRAAGGRSRSQEGDGRRRRAASRCS